MFRAGARMNTPLETRNGPGPHAYRRAMDIDSVRVPRTHDALVHDGLMMPASLVLGDVETGTCVVPAY